MIKPQFKSDKIMHMLDAIRDPNRTEIIFLLGEAGPLNVGDIAASFQISRPAISHHLRVLKDAGIVQSTKQGQEIYYQLDRELLVSSLRQLADAFENCCKNPPE